MTMVTIKINSKLYESKCVSHNINLRSNLWLEDKKNILRNKILQKECSEKIFSSPFATSFLIPMQFL